MGYLSVVFNKYYNSDSIKEKESVKKEFLNRIWNSSLPYTVLEKSFKYKVSENNIYDNNIRNIFYQYCDIKYKVLKSRYNINLLGKEDLIKMRINSNYAKYCDEEVYLDKNYYRHLAHVKNIYFKYINGEYDLDVENEILKIINKANDIKILSQNKKMKLDWDRYKGFINSCFDKIFDNYTPIDNKIEQGEFSPSLILDWDEDNYIIGYVNKSLTGYIKMYYNENIGKRYSNKKRKSCVVCGKEIVLKSNNSRQKYCKECKKTISNIQKNEHKAKNVKSM